MSNNKFILKRLCEKVPVYLLVIFSILLSIAQPGSSQQNVKYYLEINEKTWDSFDVNVTIQNNKFDRLLCGIPDFYPWLGKNYSNHTSDISGFVVSDAYGEKLSFNQINSYTWLINTNKKNVVIISYKVNTGKDQILGECINKTFARVDCGSVFIYIREFKNSSMQIGARVPHGWKLATGMKSTSQIYEYHVDNYEQLTRHTLYMARFDEIYFTLNGRTCFIIIDGKQNSYVRKLSTIPVKAAFYQAKLFNDIPFDKYIFIFKIFPGQREVVSKAYENTSIMYLTYEAAKTNQFDIAKKISSNFFQVWNGNRFFPKSMKLEEYEQFPCSNSMWFYYGVSDYYGSLSLVRSGFWSEEDFINDNIKLINRLLRFCDQQLPSVTMLSSHIMKFDYKKSMDLIRLKGHLIGLLLDLKIRELTGNRRSLDDVMFFMDKWFGNERLGYGDSDILRAICAVAGVDLTSFFDLYINGTAKLPFIESFQTAGIFLESKLDTVPDLGEISITNEDKIVSNLSKNGPYAVSGVKVGDEFTSLNDQKIYYPGQIEQISDSLVVGQEVDISIKREGISLMLIAKVKGKLCEVVSFVSHDSLTEKQHIIRKSWLSAQLPQVK